MKHFFQYLYFMLILGACACTGPGNNNQVEEYWAKVLITEEVTDITPYTAKLNASFSDFPEAPRELGFEWGTSKDKLDRTIQSQYIANSGEGNYTCVLDGLTDNTTYFLRAYLVAWENNQGIYYYGKVRPFSTKKDENKPDPGTEQTESNQPGWYEVPLMNIVETDNYKKEKSNADYYYAIHMCSGGEKGPGGKTARNYTVCFSADKHCPVWVAAPRHSMYVGSSGRNEAYRADDAIPANIQYNSKSTGGGCNKGHMLGSAERTSSVSTNKDVFFYSNIAPQLSSGFNTSGGGWNKLEDWVDLQVCADTLYEVLGCCFEKYTDGYGFTVEPQRIEFGGRNDVGFPTMFYYVLLRTKSGNSGKALKDCSSSELKCAAFVRSHTNSLKGQVVSSKEMMSVSALEEITGITYFPNVPNAPKGSFKASDWGL